MTLPAVIFDIDGTLANTDHRNHLAKSKDWKGFFEAMIFDGVNQDIKLMLDCMKEKHYDILLVTGRSDEYKEQTRTWLNTHGIRYDALFMREEKDFRKDFVIKKELYDLHIAPTYEVRFVVEDRSSVVDMWRELGLTCLQCARGDF